MIESMPCQSGWVEPCGGALSLNGDE